MSEEDKKVRVEFAKKCMARYNNDLWLSRVTMYYDGVSFYHRLHPYADSRAPRKKVWRKRGEGLQITAKGRKEGNNGTLVRLFVAISHGKGVVMCEEFNPEQKYNGENYASFVKENFPEAMQISSNGRNKLILQDGDPVQNSKKAKNAYTEIGAKIFLIPARSPDLNPIENIFHLVR